MLCIGLSTLQDLTVKVELQLGNSLPPLLVVAAFHMASNTPSACALTLVHWLILRAGLDGQG
jgi:hypothetical protein